MTNKETDFERMVREHKSTIYTVCYMFSKDTDEVNDLFQEVLINLWKGFDGFRGESKVDTWIWRIALNTCISDDRKKKRRGERVPLEMAADLYTDTDEDTKQIPSFTRASTSWASWTALSSCFGWKTLAMRKLVPSPASPPKTFP